MADQIKEQLQQEVAGGFISVVAEPVAVPDTSAPQTQAPASERFHGSEKGALPAATGPPKAPADRNASSSSNRGSGSSFSSGSSRAVEDPAGGAVAENTGAPVAAVAASAVARERSDGATAATESSALGAGGRGPGQEGAKVNPWQLEAADLYQGWSVLEAHSVNNTIVWWLEGRCYLTYEVSGALYTMRPARVHSGCWFAYHYMHVLFVVVCCGGEGPGTAPHPAHLTQF
jgi:hypothetical protein